MTKYAKTYLTPRLLSNQNFFNYFGKYPEIPCKKIVSHYYVKHRLLKDIAKQVQVMIIITNKKSIVIYQAIKLSFKNVNTDFLVASTASAALDTLEKHCLQRQFQEKLILRWEMNSQRLEIILLFDCV